ncbi:unnamed protein product [Nyctereutes procyonoides]|uniref:(raccoon dog) hypothetical protein n=1 Tax=Nyctereutes procyonoides TaxID=34880 RepID=A0A811ZS26_NYCPR|nr:unnamed protein product [Nyctereutes procyonoides]
MLNLVRVLLYCDCRICLLLRFETMELSSFLCFSGGGLCCFYLFCQGSHIDFCYRKRARYCHKLQGKAM